MKKSTIKIKKVASRSTVKVKKEKQPRAFKRVILIVLFVALILLVLLVLITYIKIQFWDNVNHVMASAPVNQEEELLKVQIAKEEILKNPDYLAEDPIVKVSETNLENLSFENNVPILMYHYIEPEDPTQSKLRINLGVTPDNFEKQVKWLYDNGYKTLTMSQYFSLVSGNKEMPKKSVIITVDDGYIDFFENAAPILNRYNMTATIFIITNSVGYPAYMNWDQIKLLSDEGFEVDSHTLTHPNLTKLNDDGLNNELVNSKKKLEEMTGKNVNFLCYPMGFFDKRVEDAARNAGYKGAVTTESGYRVSNKNIFTIPRLRVTHTISDEGFGWMIKGAQ